MEVKFNKKYTLVLLRQTALILGTYLKISLVSYLTPAGFSYDRYLNIV